MIYYKTIIYTVFEHFVKNSLFYHFHFCVILCSTQVGLCHMCAVDLLFDIAISKKQYFLKINLLRGTYLLC